MHPAVERIKASWLALKQADSGLRPGASVARLDAFERQHGVNLPPVLRELYACTDGTEGMIGESLIQLLPLGEVVSARDHPSVARDAPTPGAGWPEAPDWTRWWYVFGDYLISSHAYLVRLSAIPGDPGPVALWGFGQEPERTLIAPSVAAFLDLWAQDDDRGLLVGNGPIPADDPGPGFLPS